MHTKNFLYVFEIRGKLGDSRKHIRTKSRAPNFVCFLQIRESNDEDKLSRSEPKKKVGLSWVDAKCIRMEKVRKKSSFRHEKQTVGYCCCRTDIKDNFGERKRNMNLSDEISPKMTLLNTGQKKKYSAFEFLLSFAPSPRKLFEMTLPSFSTCIPHTHI